MIAFEVRVNDELICTAGLEDFGVLSAIISWVRRRPENSLDRKSIEEELTAEIGGLNSLDEHLTWLSKALMVGDSFSLRIVNVDKVDAPIRKYKDDPAAIAQAKREYYEELKREFGD